MVSYLGQSVKRLEDPRLVTGNGSFVDDITLPDLLHAATLRSPYAHARIRAVDAAASRNLPGVVAVLTGEDVAGVLGNIPTRALDRERAMDEYLAPEHPALAQDKVCYVGQAVAIVVAEDPFTARDAAELIEVDYEPLDPVIDPREAAKPDAPVIHPAAGTNVAMRLQQGSGDVDAAFANADHVVQQSYEVQRIAPAPMEPRGVVAQYQELEDLLTVWNSTQAPHRVRGYLAQLLERPESTIRVIAPDVGGSFGLKDCMFPEDVLVPYLALRLGRPIKYVEDRQENMLAYHGRGQTMDVAMGVKSDGTILGLRASVIADMGAYFLMTSASAPSNVCRRMPGPYHIPAITVELSGVVTNKTPVGAFRGTGSPEAAYCMERTLDLAARDLGLDPAEIRRRNFIPADAFPYQSPTGMTYDSGNYELGLERALELAGYSAWQEEARQRRPDGPLVGVGLATVLKSSGASGDHRVESAQVSIDPSGQVTVSTGISPHGQGSETSFAQIAAHELGLSPNEVRVLHGDTDTIPTGEGTSASRGLIVGGSAVHSVLQDARRKLSLVAGHLLDCPPENVSFQEGMALDSSNPAKSLAFPALAAAAHNRESLPRGVEPGLDFSGEYTLPNSPFSFGAHVAAVEVSRETGQVKILRYVGVHDVGRIVNPLLVEGQIHGGIAQGIGQALVEGAIYGDDGQPLAGSLLDYALPRATGMPDLILDTIEVPSPTNPLGAKGVGSVSTVPSPVAVCNAVMDALSGPGVRHLDTPLTAEKVWQAIQDAQ